MVVKVVGSKVVGMVSVVVRMVVKMVYPSIYFLPCQRHISQLRFILPNS